MFDIDEISEAIAERVAEKLASRAKRSLSPKEYATAHTLGNRTVYRAIAEGRLPHDRIGRLVRIPVDATISKGAAQ